MSKIVILTGAGISAESGLGTFRDEDGLWAKHAIEDVATPEGFSRNPGLVHEFYNARRAQAAEATPNAAHVALARLEAEHEGQFLLVTQNVDALHEKAGSLRVIHMHGELAGAMCNACDDKWVAPLVMSPEDECGFCGAKATRPDVVWFGEIPYAMDAIDAALSEADIFAAIGTSGQVYPAANFGYIARNSGAHTIELNLETSGVSSDFAETRRGKASEIVPAWVEEILDN
ncbi:MAG: NAD-dependent deacylase [Pseudomonadota bacterium]